MHKTPCQADPSFALAASYGNRAFEVTKIAEERRLGKRLARGYPMLEAEVTVVPQLISAATCGPVTVPPAQCCSCASAVWLHQVSWGELSSQSALAVPAGGSHHHLHVYGAVT